MADLNKLMSEVQKESSDIEKSLKKLLIKYETLYKEGHRIFSAERIAADSMDGLESFHRLVQTIRRNRDVIGSLLRGTNNLRSIAAFKVIEEEIPVKKPAKRKRPKSQSIEHYEPEPELAVSEELDG